MSYTRSYSEIVSRTVSVPYPKSDSGGSTNVTVDIPVDINILVDTRPFDNSVENCGSNIDLLTGAVVATETAEIASKELNSQKVAETIIGGFFSYIRSEISQQIAELSQNIDAHLMHLKELAKSCVEKKKQMQGDYIRISGRYIKVFEDLNNEVSNRIFELDKSTFVFKNETDKQRIRTTDNELVNTVTIFGLESSSLQSKISSSIAKKRALDTLYKAKVFLWQQKKLDSTIGQSMLNENTACDIFTPVCFVETHNLNNQIDRVAYISDYLTVLNDKSQKDSLVEHFSSKSVNWKKLSSDDQKNITVYFNEELNSKSVSNDKHSVRVREMIQKIAVIGAIDSISFQQN